MKEIHKRQSSSHCELSDGVVRNIFIDKPKHLKEEEEKEYKQSPKKQYLWSSSHEQNGQVSHPLMFLVLTKERTINYTTATTIKNLKNVLKKLKN
jgi:hypothetical protein